MKNYKDPEKDEELKGITANLGPLKVPTTNDLGSIGITSSFHSIESDDDPTFLAFDTPTTVYENQGASNLNCEFEDCGYQDIKKHLEQQIVTTMEEKMKKLWNKQKEQYELKVLQLQNDLDKTTANLKALKKNETYTSSKNTGNKIETMVRSSTKKRSIVMNPNTGSKKQKTNKSAADIITNKTTVSVYCFDVIIFYQKHYLCLFPKNLLLDLTFTVDQ